MASTVSKQQVYRRLMREQKAKLTTSSSTQQNTINHPLAKYNNLGQLTCVVCSLHIKSEILWTTHLQSRKHKDRVLELKAKGAPSRALQADRSEEKRDVVSPDLLPTGGKRKNDDESLINEDPSPKKRKKSKTRRDPSTSSSSANSGLPAGFFDSNVKKKFVPRGEEVMYVSSESEEDTPMSEDTLKEASTSSVPPSADVPTNFFDSNSESKQNVESQDNSKKGPKKNKDLPEGFFDDPKKDAKARKVEYKDPLTEEWDRFQKSIQKEDDVSEALVFEGDEETMEERELEEINEQVNCFTKAEQLRQKHEELLSQTSKQISNLHDQTTTELNSSDDETEFNELLSWRAKIS